MRRGFLNWGYRLERWLIKMVILGAILVIITQAVLVHDPLRMVTSQVGFPADSLQKPNCLNNAVKPMVTLQLMNYTSLPEIWVLVNGEPQKNFLHRYVTIAVKDGDILEIDGTFYKHLLEVNVLDTSKEILSPKPGQSYKINGNLVRLGKVKLEGYKLRLKGDSR